MKNNKKETVETILASAAELFSAKGFDKTSMQDLVSAAGISKGAIYHYFKSKEEIVEAVLNQHAVAIKVQFAEWMQETAGCSARDRLVKILEMNLEEQAKSALHTSLLHEVKSAEFIVQHMKACVEISAPMISNLIGEGILDGSISTDYPDEVAEIFFLMINIWCDPSIMVCNTARLEKRIRCSKNIMKNLGVDIITEEMVVGMIRLFERSR